MKIDTNNASPLTCIDFYGFHRFKLTSLNKWTICPGGKRLRYASVRVDPSQSCLSLASRQLTVEMNVLLIEPVVTEPVPIYRKDGWIICSREKIGARGVAFRLVKSKGQLGHIQKELVTILWPLLKGRWPRIMVFNWSGFRREFSTHFQSSIFATSRRKAASERQISFKKEKKLQ